MANIAAYTVLLLGGGSAMAEEDQPDLEFLEWLGQTAEVEELGVDLDKWLLSKKKESATDDAEVNSQ